MYKYLDYLLVIIYDDILIEIGCDIWNKECSSWNTTPADEKEKKRKFFLFWKHETIKNWKEKNPDPSEWVIVDHQW